MLINNVTIIGTGNVAHVLGKLMLNKGITIKQVYGRTKVLTTQLATQLKAAACNHVQQLQPNSDLYLICVADNAVEEIASQISFNNIAHTAGSLSKDVLKQTSQHYGVLYPLQSIRANNPILPNIPFLIDASTRTLQYQLLALGNTIGTNTVICGDEQRLAMHLAAVFSSNFTNFMYICAQDICNTYNVPFNTILPLIYETANRITPTQLPNNLQTGPAIRNDNKTMQKHMDMIASNKHLRTLYQSLSAAIQERLLNK
jgi:predicted short-subunit dehydrogenase-like oxidoreductase (DUF2520 family)